jgi:hypothetical protein
MLSMFAQMWLTTIKKLNFKYWPMILQHIELESMAVLSIPKATSLPK